jgi:poly(3-hydroxybutyrate) depolymerase
MKNLTAIVGWLLMLNTAYSQHCISGRYGELPIFDQSELLIDANVPYAEVTHTFTGQMLTLQLDVWRPDPLVDPVTSRPLVLLIHGGSFLAGNRNEMNSYCEGFARRGYVAATITYRLGWDCDPNAGIFLCGVCGPQQNKLRTAVYNAIQDAHAAARFLYANAEMYGIDPEHFFIGGVSAGSITALGAAMLSQAEANGFAPSAEALSGGLFESGNALPQAHHFKAVLNNCGAVPAVSVLNPEVSVISFHDDGDCVVPYGNGRVLGCLGCNSFPVVAGSQSIHNELVAAGGCSELNTQQISLLHCSWPTGNAIARASCFFKRTLCGVCTGVSNNSSSTSSPCMALGIPCDTTVDDPSQGGCEADLNNDGVVNTADLSAFLSAFGSFCDD